MNSAGGEESGSTTCDEEGDGGVGGGGGVHSGRGIVVRVGAGGAVDGEDGVEPPAGAAPTAGAAPAPSGDAAAGGGVAGGGSAAAPGPASPALHLSKGPASGDEPERGFCARYGCAHSWLGESVSSRTVAAGTSARRWHRARCMASAAWPGATFSQRVHSSTGHAVGAVPAADATASAGFAAHPSTWPQKASRPAADLRRV